MNGLGLAAPNRIRCTRAVVARPYGGSLRLRGLVVDTKTCVRCGSEFGRGDNHPGQWARRQYCSLACYRGRDSSPLAERFWRYVAKGAECWEWAAALGGSHYGTFAIDRNRQTPAHRFSWELHFGPIPAGLLVCHHCDNRLCVRPDHLFLGTPLANTRDMDRKGRRVTRGLPGESNSQAKLTAEGVRDIRARLAAGERAVDLAQEFGVTATLIRRIALGKAWRHV